MTSRRFSARFLVATTFMIAATMALQVHFLRQAAQRTLREKREKMRAVKAESLVSDPPKIKKSA